MHGHSVNVCVSVHICVGVPIIHRTKARNREFYRQIEEIEARGVAWESKLREEIEQQLAANKALYSVFDEAFGPTVNTLTQQLKDTIDEYHTYGRCTHLRHV